MNFTIKILSALMCLAILAGVLSTAVFADAGATASAKHSLTDNALLKAYGFVCKSEDGADGTNADVGAAAIKTMNGNAYLELKFGDSSSYPQIYLSETVAPYDMTNYTVRADIIVADSSSNRLVNLLYGYSGTANGEAGFRTGDHAANTAENNTWGIIWLANMAKKTGSQDYFFGEGVLSESTNSQGSKHTIEVTVNAGALNQVPTIEVKIDSVTIPVTNTATLFSSRIGFSGWRGTSIGIDNLYVKDNSTGAVIAEFDFEDHAYSNVLEAVDVDNHGFICTCGLADTSAHQWNEGVEIDDANSCTTKKSMKRTCTDCGYERVFANAHTPGESVTVDDTCTEDGYVSVSCTVCGEEIQHTILECDGHDFGMWKEVNGGVERSCTVCSYIEEKAHETETTATTEAQSSSNTDSSDKSGCGAVMISPTVSILLVGTVVLFRRKKED